jgi:hypothetical protein
MATPSNDTNIAPKRRSVAAQIALKCAALTALTIGLGVAQGMTAPWFYQPERVAGFHSGVIQGALMPATLPALLLGKDVPIYAPTNEGRPYKIGYIMGLNLCGTIFFGLAMWPIRK